MSFEKENFSLTVLPLNFLCNDFIALLDGKIAYLSRFACSPKGEKTYQLKTLRGCQSAFCVLERGCCLELICLKQPFSGHGSSL